MILGIILGAMIIIAGIVIDIICIYKYGYCSLTVLIAVCWNSKRFKWLAYNIWGNDDWFYQKVIKTMEKQIAT